VLAEVEKDRVRYVPGPDGCADAVRKVEAAHINHDIKLRSPQCRIVLGKWSRRSQAFFGHGARGVGGYTRSWRESGAGGD